MKRKKTILLLCACALIACSKLPDSVGRPRDVVVISSTVDTAVINRTIQITNQFPQPEPMFIVVYAADSATHAVKTFQTLFLYGSLKDAFISALLNPEARAAVQRDTFALFRIKDLWAHPQTAVILAVSDPEQIAAGLSRYRAMIRTILEENYYARLKDRYYGRPVDVDLKRKIAKFGFTVDVQPGWRIDSTFRRDNFVFIHSHYPDRSIFFFHEPLDHPITDSFVLKKRDQLTRRFYGGDYLLRDLSRVEPVEFKNLRGFRIKGVWQNDSLVAGGPFLSYVLAGERTLYFIDGSLFLPGERKTDYYMTLEIIMNSVAITLENASP